MHLPIVGDHVRNQLDGVNGFLAHKEVGLSVIVDKCTRINEIPVRYHTFGGFGQQELPQWIPERTVGLG